jgi:hypothetical protein
MNFRLIFFVLFLTIDSFSQSFIGNNLIGNLRLDYTNRKFYFSYFENSIDSRNIELVDNKVILNTNIVSVSIDTIDCIDSNIVFFVPGVLVTVYNSENKEINAIKCILGQYADTIAPYILNAKFEKGNIIQIDGPYFKRRFVWNYSNNYCLNILTDPRVGRKLYFNTVIFKKNKNKLILIKDNSYKDFKLLNDVDLSNMHLAKQDEKYFNIASGQITY